MAEQISRGVNLYAMEQQSTTLRVVKSIPPFLKEAQERRDRSNSVSRGRQAVDERMKIHSEVLSLSQLQLSRTINNDVALSAFRIDLESIDSRADFVGESVIFEEGEDQSNFLD